MQLKFYTLTLLSMFFVACEESNLDLYMPSEGGADVVVFSSSLSGFEEKTEANTMALTINGSKVTTQNYDFVYVDENMMKHRVVVRGGEVKLRDDVFKGAHSSESPLDDVQNLKFTPK